MDMDKAPAAAHLPVDLGLATMRLDRGAILPELRCEVPVEFSPGSIPIRMNMKVFHSQTSFRERLTHQFLEDICLDRLPPVFVPHWMNEGDIGRVGPDLGGELGVGG